jgi:hypothetical protein
MKMARGIDVCIKKVTWSPVISCVLWCAKYSFPVPG